MEGSSEAGQMMKYRALLRRLMRKLPPVPPKVIRVGWVTSKKTELGECQPRK
jgi:hypothetical protein